MDWGEEKLDEDIQQIQLVLQSTDPNQAPSSSRQIVEEDSDDADDQLHISLNQGLHKVADTSIPSTSNISLDGRNDETGDDETGAEEELGDTLETALKLNLAYQELLRMHMTTIKELLDKNIAHQKMGQEQLVEQISEKSKPTKEDVFAYPYFKDKWGSGPPKNQDAVIRDQMFPRLEPPRVWKVYQEDILLGALYEQMKSKCLKDLHLRLRKLRQGIITDESITEDELIYTIDCVKTSFELGDVPVEDVIAHADWLTIANNLLEGAFSTESCINLYRNICNPLINRSQWSTEEDEKLKELVTTHGHQSWSLVANELGTDRSPFLCLQRYQQALNEYETATWSATKVKALLDYMESNLGKEDTISWDRVAWRVGEMTPNECKVQWESMDASSKKKWTNKEDQALINAVALYGDRTDVARKWMYVAAYVKTRNSCACRDRWLNRLRPERKFLSWTVAEDKILYDYLVEFNSKVGTDEELPKYEITKLRETYFPERIGNSITQRLKALQKKMANGGIDDKYFETAMPEEQGKQEVEGKENERNKDGAESERFMADEAAETGDEGEEVIDGGAVAGSDEEAGPEDGQLRRSRRRRRPTVDYLGDHYVENYPTVSHRQRSPFINNKNGKRLRNSLARHMETGALEDTDNVLAAVKQNCLSQLLAGYPVLTAGSRHLVTNLRNSIQLMLNRPSIHLHTSVVNDFLANKRKSFNQAMKERDHRVKEVTLTVIDVSSGKGLPRRRMTGKQEVVNGRKTLLETETEILNILFRRRCGTLTDDVRKQYMDLINKSIMDEVSLAAFRKKCFEEKNVELKLDLPYILPPNQITLSAYYQLLQSRIKLSHYARHRSDIDDRFKVQNCIRDIKQTEGYKKLREKVRSLFLWPAALCKANPQAVVFQAMTAKTTKAARRAGSTPCTLFQAAATQVAPGAVATNSSGKLPPPATVVAPVGTGQASNLVRKQVAPATGSLNKTASANTEASGSAKDKPPPEGEVYTVVAGVTPLPKDVADIISRALEKKNLGEQPANTLTERDRLKQKVRLRMKQEKKTSSHCAIMCSVVEDFRTVVQRNAVPPKNAFRLPGNSNMQAVINEQPSKTYLPSESGHMQAFLDLQQRHSKVYYPTGMGAHEILKVNLPPKGGKTTSKRKTCTSVTDEPHGKTMKTSEVSNTELAIGSVTTAKRGRPPRKQKTSLAKTQDDSISGQLSKSSKMTTSAARSHTVTSETLSHVENTSLLPLVTSDQPSVTQCSLDQRVSPRKQALPQKAKMSSNVVKAISFASEARKGDKNTSQANNDSTKQGVHLDTYRNESSSGIVVTTKLDKTEDPETKELKLTKMSEKIGEVVAGSTKRPVTYSISATRSYPPNSCKAVPVTSEMSNLSATTSHLPFDSLPSSPASSQPSKDTNPRGKNSPKRYISKFTPKELSLEKVSPKRLRRRDAMTPAVPYHMLFDQSQSDDEELDDSDLDEDYRPTDEISKKKPQLH